jgi:hypothetical protein
MMLEARNWMLEAGRRGRLTRTVFGGDRCA